MTGSKEIKEFIKNNRSEDETILQEYSGIFNQSLVKKYALTLSKLCNEYIVTQRRIFYIFVELAQNVGYYSDYKEKVGNKEIGAGEMLIYETEKEIGFSIGNIINNSALNVLRRKCKIINSMDRESLREFKRHQRNLIPGTNGGAHIGLIMVALTTRKKLDFKILEIDENMSFLAIDVKIEKIKE